MRRILPVAVLALVAFLYYKPIKAYERTKSELAQRRGEVASLRSRNDQLQATLGSVDSGPMLVREARRLGLVRPGERLFIVKGIDGWRAARAKAGGHG